MRTTPNHTTLYATVIMVMPMKINVPMWYIKALPFVFRVKIIHMMGWNNIAMNDCPWSIHTFTNC